MFSLIAVLLILCTIAESWDISQVLIVHERDHFRRKYKTNIGFLSRLDASASLIMCTKISYPVSSNERNVLDLMDTIVRRQRTVVDLLSNCYCAFAFRRSYVPSCQTWMDAQCDEVGSVVNERRVTCRLRRQKIDYQ